MVDRLVDSEFDVRLLFNQKTTALLVGISVQAFSHWAVQPSSRQGREALYYWPDVLEERDRRKFAQPEGEEGEVEYLDLDQQKARLAKEQADKHALENAARRGELLEVSVIEKAWLSIFTALRAKVLSLPTKVAAELAAIKDANRIRDLLTDEAHQILAEASAYRPEDSAAIGSAASESGGDDTQAAAAADSEPVGRRRAKAKSRE
jgi:phage terminase Nu1 subunit (DNA packaging protein)